MMRHDTGPLPRTHILKSLKKTYRISGGVGLSAKEVHDSIKIALEIGLENGKFEVNCSLGSKRYKIGDEVAKEAKPAPKEDRAPRRSTRLQGGAPAFRGLKKNNTPEVNLLLLLLKLVPVLVHVEQLTALNSPLAGATEEVPKEGGGGGEGGAAGGAQRGEYTKTNANTSNLSQTRTISFLAATVERKERELECLVCLEVVSPPILGCQELHLICSKCQPKLSK
jgi:hypothetical protein